MDVITLLGLAMAAVGVFVAWYGLRRHRSLGARHAAATASWRKTTATVVDARLVDHQDSNSEGYDTSWIEPRLHYRYAVDGAPYDGRQTALGTPLRFDVPTPAQQWLAAHAPGATIDAWYDPARPGDSAPSLDAPARGSAVTTIGIGAALAVFGLVVALNLI